MTHSATRTFRRGSLAGFSASLLALLFITLTAAPAQAQVEGISYSISPVGEYMLFDSDGLLGTDGQSGLENGLLYGGELGLGFGQYLTVGGEYLINRRGVDTSDDFAVDQSVDLKRYGGTIRVNLGNFNFAENGGFQPFITGGAGVFEFDPEEQGTTETIYAKAGAGVTFSALDRFNLSLGGQVLSYKYNPVTTFGAAEGGEQIVYAPSARASVSVFLGGRRPGQQTALDRAFRQQFSEGQFRLFVEPFYGRIEFNEALKAGDGGLQKDQNVAGVNAGLQLGPQVGLRGFYWRGVTGEEDVFDQFAENFEDMALYGGELNLRFGSQFGGQSFTPYLILGGGYMNFFSGYDFGTPDDRYFASGGAGALLPLSPALKLQGGVRSLFMSNVDAENVTDPDQIYGSLMYTAGLQFSFGDGPDDSLEEVISQRESQTRREALIRDQATRAEVRRLQTRIDSLEQQRQRQLRGEGGLSEQEQQRFEELQQQVEQLRSEQEQQAGQQRPQFQGQQQRFGQRGQQQRGQQQAEQQRQQFQGQQQRGQQPPRAAGSSNLSGETINLPVPERGEIYVRFGENADDVQVETVYGPPSIVAPQGVAPQSQQQAPQQQAPQQQMAPTSQAGQMTPEQIRQIVSQAVQSELQQADQQGRSLSEQDVSNIVRETIREEMNRQGGSNLSQRLDDQERQSDRELRRLREELEREREARRRGETPPEVNVVEGGDGQETVVVQDRRGGLGGSRYAPDSYVPLIGYGHGDSDRFLIGARGAYEAGSGLQALGFRFAPEAVLGLGDGLGLDLAVNGTVGLNFVQQYVPYLEPYVGAGLGLTTETGFGINLLVGSELEFGNGAAFVEYDTMSFFDYNRFLLGYRTRL